MAWIKVTETYTYRKPAFSIRYKPGAYNVTSECATLAIAAGKAVRLKKTHKDEEPQEWQPNEAVREASPSESNCKSGQPQPTNMETKSAAGS